MFDHWEIYPDQKYILQSKLKEHWVVVSCISISDLGKKDFAYQKHFYDLSGKFL